MVDKWIGWWAAWLVGWLMGGLVDADGAMTDHHSNHLAQTILDRGNTRYVETDHWLRGHRRQRQQR